MARTRWDDVESIGLLTLAMAASIASSLSNSNTGHGTKFSSLALRLQKNNE